MKLYLIAVLFIATLVVVPCLAEEEKQETTEQGELRHTIL